MPFAFNNIKCSSSRKSNNGILIDYFHFTLSASLYGILYIILPLFEKNTIDSFSISSVRISIT